jgi:hypothetical protein
MTKGGSETVSTESGPEGSNPAPSSGESANHRSLSSEAASTSRGMDPVVSLVSFEAKFRATSG